MLTSLKSPPMVDASSSSPSSSSSPLTSLATSPPTSPQTLEFYGNCWIERLPDELLLMIFESMVPPKTTARSAFEVLGACTLVCRRWSVYSQRVAMYNVAVREPESMSKFFDYFTSASVRAKLRIKHISISTSARDPNKRFFPTLRKFLSCLSHVTSLELIVFFPLEHRPLRVNEDWRQLRRIILDQLRNKLTSLQLHFRPGLDKPFFEQSARLVWSLPHLQYLELIHTKLDDFYPRTSKNAGAPPTDCPKPRSNKLQTLIITGTWKQSPRLLHAFDLTGLKRFTLFGSGSCTPSFPVEILTDEKWSNLKKLDVPLMKDCSSVALQTYLRLFPNVRNVHLWCGWYGWDNRTIDSSILTFLPATVMELTLDFCHLVSEETFLEHLADDRILPALQVLTIRIMNRPPRTHLFRLIGFFKSESALRDTCERRQINLNLCFDMEPNCISREWASSKFRE